MKKKLLTIMLVTTMALSFTACGGSSSSDNSKSSAKTETAVDKTDESTNTTDGTSSSNETSDETSAPSVSIDMDKCISDLKANLQLEPDYTFVQDYYIGVKDTTITISAVVDDATNPAFALDFADTLVRQLNLYAQFQDSSIESASKDFYGGLYERYNALVGVAPASQQNNTDKWFVYDGIVGGKVMLKLNKAYR